MKKLIPCFLLLISFNSIFAQNATKEETVKWLENYGSNLLRVNYIDYPVFLKVTLGSELIEVSSSYNTKSCYHYKSIGFGEIESIELLLDGRIKIFTYSKGSFLRKEVFDYQGDFEKSGLAYIYCKDLEGAKRIYNALKHLLSFYDYKIQFDDPTEVEDKF